MIIQIGNYFINLSSVTFWEYKGEDGVAQSVVIHFVGGDVLTLDNESEVKAFGNALSSLRFGVGMQLPNGQRPS